MSNGDNSGKIVETLEMEILITLREKEMTCHVGTMKIAHVNSDKIVEKCTN